MTDSATELGYLRDPRLSAHAVAPAPVWLWSADGAQLLWCNAPGAAIFATAPEAKDAAAKEIARIAPGLAADGRPKLERLGGIEGARSLTCGCSRITLDDGRAAVLIVAAEAAGPSLSLDERVERLVAGLDNAAAVFAPDGSLFHAGDAQFAGTTLEAIGADALALHALRAGYASGASKLGAVNLERIGSDAVTFLLASLPAVKRAVPPPAPVLDAATPAPVITEPPVIIVEEPAPPSSEQPAAPSAEEPAADVFAPETAATEQASAEVTAAEDAPPETHAAAEEAPTAEAPPPETPAPEAPPPEPSMAAAPTPELEIAGRRYPVRFIWHMDAEERFSIDSGDFLQLTGAPTAEVQGQPWSAVAQRLGVDTQGAVADAIASRTTWSGITLEWPMEGSDEKLPVELSGLPIFNAERAFGGYRGFGICRDARKASRAATLPEPGVPHATQAETPPERANEAAPAEGTSPAEQHPETAAPEEPTLSAEQRPQLTLVPQAENVVPFRSANNDRAPTLTPVERTAFQEIAKELTSRLQETPANEEIEPEPAEQPAANESGANSMGFVPPRESPRAELPPEFEPDHTILDRLPQGVLVYRLDTPLYANPAFLKWSGYSSAASLTSAGGLDVLFVEPLDQSADADLAGQPLRVTSNRGKQITAEGRLFTAPWEGDPAHVLMLLPQAASAAAAAPADDSAVRAAQAEARDLRTILDTATDAVLVLESDGRIIAANAGAEALFARAANALNASSFNDLIAPESQAAVLEYLAEMARAESTSKIGRELVGRGGEGGLLPLHMTLGRLDEKRFCAVFRDLTSWKKTEMELVAARRQAEKASAAKSEFLAKISHEIRTPLNSIIGFSEVMMDERFGPIGNERYRHYLKDVHTSGTHLLSLLNDLLDLSKIEAGKMDLIFGRVSLNEVTQQCVSLMQPQANQERVIIRTSLPKVLPPVMADARSVRQIVLNLLSNSIKFTGAGGQVIISTAQTDDGEVVLRVRDTGQGMTEKEIQMALEPFRQIATSSRLGSGGTGLGLPLTKALAEANRANFSIRSSVNAGTLVEVAFPPNRVLVA